MFRGINLFGAEINANFSEQHHAHLFLNNTLYLLEFLISLSSSRDGLIYFDYLKAYRRITYKYEL